jgi:hypothetical protein
MCGKMERPVCKGPNTMISEVIQLADLEVLKDNFW